jgi:hypothetical protein
VKKHYFIIILLAAALFVFSSCSGADNSNTGNNEGTDFQAIVLENNGTNLLVEPVEGSDELRSADKITVHVNDDIKLLDSQNNEINIDGIEAGDRVQIFYNGAIAESYPAQINKCYRIVRLD